MSIFDNGDNETREATNQRHLHEPKIGDYWNEMFAPILVVVGTRPDGVLVCQKIKDTDRDHWTWDLSKVVWLSSAEFIEALTYGGTGPLKDTTHCDVVPEAHKWVREAAIETMFG